jgi:hypothetical protein
MEAGRVSRGETEAERYHRCCALRCDRPKRRSDARTIRQRAAPDVRGTGPGLASRWRLRLGGIPPGCDDGRRAHQTRQRMTILRAGDCSKAGDNPLTPAANIRPGAFSPVQSSADHCAPPGTTDLARQAVEAATQPCVHNSAAARALADGRDRGRMKLPRPCGRRSPRGRRVLVPWHENGGKPCENTENPRNSWKRPKRVEPA